MTDRREVMKVMGMTAMAGLCGVYPRVATGRSTQMTRVIKRHKNKSRS